MPKRVPHVPWFKHYRPDEIRPYAEAAPLAVGESVVELRLDQARALDIAVATTGPGAVFLESVVARRDAG